MLPRPSEVLIEIPHGGGSVALARVAATLALVQYDGGRPVGYAPAEDDGPLDLFTDGRWFLAGTLPPGSCRVELARSPAEVRVSNGAWIASIPGTAASVDVVFLDDHGAPVAERSEALPAIVAPPRRGLWSRLRGPSKGLVTYSPRRR